MLFKVPAGINPAFDHRSLLGKTGPLCVKQYSTAKTFNYKVYLGLGRLFITIVVKWDVKGKKKTLCTAYISRKIKTGVGVIEKITKNKIKITNAKRANDVGKPFPDNIFLCLCGDFGGVAGRGSAGPYIFSISIF